MDKNCVRGFCVLGKCENPRLVFITDWKFEFVHRKRHEIHQLVLVFVICSLAKMWIGFSFRILLNAEAETGKRDVVMVM